MGLLQCVYVRLSSVASIIIIKLYFDLKVESLSGNQAEVLKKNMPLEATGNIMSFNVPEPTHDKSITIDLPTGFNEKRQVKINGDTYVLIKQRSEWKKIDAVFDKKNLGALRINATSKFEGLVCIPHSSIKLLNLIALI